jgi:hypothetical protein
LDLNWFFNNTIKLNDMKLFRLIPIMLLLFVLSSCKDSLTIQPDNKTVADGYYDSGQKVEQAVVGGYVDLRRALIANYAWVMYGEARAGDLTVVTDYQQLVATQKLTGDNRFLKQLTDWGYFYDVIKDANDVLDIIAKADNSVLDNNHRKLYRGEALALKSMAYFYLGRIWGDVPSAEKNNFGRKLNNTEVVTLAAGFAVEAKNNLPWRLLNDDGIESTALTAIRFNKTSITLLLAQEQLWLGKPQDAYTALTTTFTTATADSISVFGLSLGVDRRTTLPERPLGTTASLISMPLDKFNTIYPTGDTRRNMFNVSAANSKATLVVRDAGVLDLLPTREINLLLAEAAWRTARLTEAKAAMVKGTTGATENYNNLTDATFGDAILLERRRQLVGTGQRMFDLVRFGKVSTFIPSLTDADVQKGAGYWPLSASSITGNSLSQNSYWLSKN